MIIYLSIKYPSLCDSSFHRCENALIKPCITKEKLRLGFKHLWITETFSETCYVVLISYLTELYRGIRSLLYGVACWYWRGRVYYGRRRFSQHHLPKASLTALWLVRLFLILYCHWKLLHQSYPKDWLRFKRPSYTYSINMQEEFAHLFNEDIIKYN